MNKTLILFIALAATFIAASPALADVKEGAFTVSPFLGGVVHDASQSIKPGFIGGIRSGYNLNSHLGVEFNAAYSEPKSDINQRHGELYNIGGELLYHFFPEKRVVPFFALGGSWLRVRNSPINGRDAAIDYGAGLKYFIYDDLVALRLDFRHMYVFHGSDKNSNGYWQNAQFTAGLSFQFGPAKAPIPVIKAIEPAALAAPSPPPEPTWLADTTVVPQGKIMITGMKIDQNVLEIMATERIRDYKVFTLSQPSRLVIDIPNTISGLSVTRILVDRLGIATVRLESYPDYLRIFLDAKEGRLIPYRIEETDKGLKVIITTP
jgi:hypothetical protein